MLAENFGNDWLKIDLPFPCEIHPCYPRANPNPARFRVLSHTAEPAPLKWEPAQVRAHHQFFDLILTTDESLLDLPNARFLVFGDAWIKVPPERKEFSLSYLWSAGIGAPWDGYAMREKLWQVRREVETPRRFWYSQRRPPKTIESDDQMYPAESKALLFESMFSVVVENIREKNYFTEKILDAFQTCTIPVYYGCPNIASFFDPSGMILFEDEREFLGKVNALSPQDYWDRLPAIHANRTRSMEYRDGFARLRQAILDGYQERARAGQPVPAALAQTA